MHYNLLFNGCSYTQGSELEGKNKDLDYRDKHRFSQIITDNTQLSHCNISMGGASNDRIARTTIEWLNKNTCDIAIIQFTSLTRIEYISNYEQHPSTFSFGKFDSLFWETKHKNEYEYTKEAYHNYYKKFYNENIGLYNFYKNLFILEQYFEKNNIKHLFFKLNINKPWIIKLDNSKIKMHDENGDLLDFYWQSVCKNRYQNITSIRGQIIDISDKNNFTKNYSSEGYRYLNGAHPSELGHQRISDYIINQMYDKYGI